MKINNKEVIKFTKDDIKSVTLDSHKYDTWVCLFGHTRKIHGNENRIWDKVKVKIVDRNGAIIGVSERVRFKQQWNKDLRKYTDTWLEVKVR